MTWSSLWHTNSNCCGNVGLCDTLMCSSCSVVISLSHALVGWSVLAIMRHLFVPTTPCLHRARLSPPLELCTLHTACHVFVLCHVSSLTCTLVWVRLSGQLWSCRWEKMLNQASWPLIIKQPEAKFNLWNLRPVRLSGLPSKLNTQNNLWQCCFSLKASKFEQKSTDPRH